jgi:hypothetical protein
MEDIVPEETLERDSDREGPIREASSTTDKDDDNLIYDRDRFKVDKAQRRYEFYYHDRRIVVERGVDVVDLDAHALRVHAVLIRAKIFSPFIYAC